MKFNLNKLVNDRENLLNHIYLNECHKLAGFDKMIEERREMSGEQADALEIDINLTVNGEEIDVKEFFNSYNKIVDDAIKRAATEIVREQTSGKLQEITNKIYDFEQIIDHLATSITWDDVDYQKSLFQK